MADLLQYYLFFAVIFFFYFISNSKENKQSFLFITVCALIILVGSRNVLYGRDTLGYVTVFYNTESVNLTDTTEPGFSLFVYLIHSITNNYHIFLFAAYFSTGIALYKLMNKYLLTTYEILSSVCIYVLLGILAFNMAALRQTIALSLGIIAFICAADGKFKRYLLFVALAMTFHNSAFVLLALYPLRYLNAKSYGFIFVAVCFFIGLVIPHIVLPFLQTYIPIDDRFDQYGTTYESNLSYTGFILQLILVILAFICRGDIQLENKTKNLFFNAAFLGLAIQSLTGTLAEFFRLSLYFSVFDIILIPLALSTFQGSNAKLIRSLFIIGCLVYILFLSGGGVLPRKQPFVLPIGF